MELVHLVSHCRCEVGVCVPESAGRYSRHEIKIFLQEMYGVGDEKYTEIFG